MNAAERLRVGRRGGRRRGRPTPRRGVWCTTTSTLMPARLQLRRRVRFMPSIDVCSIRAARRAPCACHDAHMRTQSAPSLASSWRGRDGLVQRLVDADLDARAAGAAQASVAADAAERGEQGTEAHPPRYRAPAPASWRPRQRGSRGAMMR